MIVCSCNLITRSEIEEVVTGFLDDDCWQVITVGMVYHAMKKRGKCCGCFPNAIGIIIETVETWHKENASPEAEIVCFVDRVRETLQAQEARRKELKAGEVARRAA